MAYLLNCPPIAYLHKEDDQGGREPQYSGRLDTHQEITFPNGSSPFVL